MLATFFLCVGSLSIIAPVQQTIQGYPKGERIYSLLSPICHQYPTRSFWIMDRPFALCSRCVSGYLGLSLGLFFPVFNLKYFTRVMVGGILLIPGIADGLLQYYTGYESINALRFITGLLGGIGIAFIMIPIFNYKRSRK